ncbi:MAG: type II toxin-antitoxin system PemK/MazF family toxin, partial [Paenibacillus sp.]|uniref:type II toxin-antitoxin system PemK/MazF family toxin n=1 Tax=Paenibacillus sp. TaxID=58172 RepID=UPI0025D89218
MAGRTEKYRPIIVHIYREEGIYPDTADILTGKVQMKQPKRMEIWFAELGAHPGTSVQEGCRPVLVISNDKGNEYAETVTVAPLTSKIKKPWLPTHLMVTEENIEMNDF